MRPRSARRAGVIVLALVMPLMLTGAASPTGRAPLPSAAGVRGAVVRLVDWVIGKTPPKPHVPQQLEGKAPGPQHQVPAAVTRAVARAEGHAPRKGAGQLPGYTFHSAKVRRFVTGAASTGGFSPASSKLVASSTTATSDLYRNADGSFTRLDYLAPVNRRNGSGKWVPTGTHAAAGIPAIPPPAGSSRNAGRMTLAFPAQPATGVKDTHVTSGALRVLEAWSGQCPATATVTVSDASGQRVGRWSGKPPASACGSDSRGGWISVPLSDAGLRALGSGRNAKLTASVTPAPAGQPAAAACSGTCGTVLMVTAASDTAPQVNDQWPPNGYNSPTLTPELIASASDADGDALQYDFTVYNADGSTLDSSGWMSSDDGTVSSGDLAWGQTYYWTVQASDGTTISPDPQIYSISTPVPQALVSSGFGQVGAAPAGQNTTAAAGQNTTAAAGQGDAATAAQGGTAAAGQNSPPQSGQDGTATASQGGTATGDQGITNPADVAGSTDPGFNPQNGNFTTQTTDISVPVTGPPLSIQRTYNSLDPSASGAFGEGWTSVLDMTVTPGQTGADGSAATEVVAYPDGEQVAFGLNSDGTYTPPQGQYGTLVPISGGFELVDKTDAIYEFTRSLTSGGYAITELNDAMGHALHITYSSSGLVTEMTSAASLRSLHFTWSTPSGASYPHVASVSTDPVTPNVSSSAITWQYNYSGDQLTSACNESQSGQPCTAYTYQSGSDYPSAVLDSGPQSYWRLNENSGSTAASSVLSNEGTDDATYSSVVQDVQPSPLAGESSSVGAAGFDGSDSYVQVPASLADEAGSMSISLWFNSSATNGVLFSESADPITDATTANPYRPVLYIGSDGTLFGDLPGTGSTPVSSTSPVNDGNWHNVVLTSDGSQEVMYVDGKQVASQPVSQSAFIQPYIYLGAGFLGGSYPDEPHSGQTAATTYFYGAMSDVATWDEPLTATQVTALYTAGTQPAALLSTITRPSGKTFEQASYAPATSAVTDVTDSDGGSWTAGAPTASGSSQVYAAAVAGANPEDYWRLNDTGTTTAVNQLNAGTATYNDVIQGVPDGPFSDATVDGFNGSSSYLALPNSLIGPGSQSVSLWFKTTATDGVLLSTSADPVTDSTTANAFTPNLYIGQDGDLNGEFFYDDAPISSGSPVNDGKWHNIVLAAGTSGQTLYLDGKPIGTASGTITGGYSDGEDNVYVGAGFLGGEWADQPNYSATDPTGYQSFFNGDIAEVAVYPQELGASDVTSEWDAAQHSPGLTPEETAAVTDPGGHTLTYRYDPLNSGRLLSFTDGLGDTTAYGYDSGGFQDSITDPDGDVTDTGYDVRGNVVSETTCQDQATGQCSTSYYTYSPNDTNTTLSAPYSANDEVLTSSDARSSSSTDTTYQTTDLYNSVGELLSATTPPVPGYPSGRKTTYEYTDGTTTAGDTDGTTIVPGGLVWETTSPAGAITETLYDAAGDVAETINADHLITKYAYDGIGRQISKTVYSDTYPNGLATSYVYDANGQVTQETEPAVTDQVTKDVHTPQITTTYDADGDILSQTTADTTGQDASRTVSYTYNAYDQKASSTDATGAVTHYTYDAYGNLASETDPAGNVTEYAYDPDGRLLTTTLENYTGSPPGSQTAVALVEDSRRYDAAGRLATDTDAMGRVTSYAYTDNGLTASITKSGPGGGDYAEETDTYDPAGNLITQVTNNGATTTDYAVDAADQVTSQTVDPSGLDRVTAYTYDADGHVITQAVSQGSASPIQTTSYTYDPMGNKTSQTIDDPGAEGPAGWWTLTQSSGTTVTDTSGTGNTATASGITWTGSGAKLSGKSGQEITTRGPVVDTTGSFSVSAWVNLTAITGSDEAVLTQDAHSMSGFYLGIDGGSDSWGFARPEEDENDPPDWAIAGTSATAKTGTWTFLTGVFNANTGTVQLYVNGTDSGGDASDPSPIAANGPLEIGAEKWDGQAETGNFDGSLTNVEVYPTALSAAEVANLYGQGRDGGDIVRGGLTTSYQVDELGQVVAETDPDGVTTSYQYDQAGNLAVTTGVTEATETEGGTPVAKSPATTTGYNTFGEKVEQEDPDNNITTYGYDADGRQISQTLPAYTPPGASSPINGKSTTAYNSLGEVTSKTDPDGNTTTYTYDQLGDQTGQTDPDGGVTTTSYDADGEVLSQTGPTGATTTDTYDYLGRQLTATDVERYPSLESYPTITSYAPTTADPDGAWKSSVTTPDREVTSYGYNAAGETTQVTDGAGQTTKYSYDALGRKTATVNPDGTSQTVTYDPAGNVVAQSSLSASGSTLTTTSAAYNGQGQQISTTNALGNTTTYTYNPAGNLTAETQPVTSSSGIVTSFGYDAAGNQTRYTDGNGNNWITTYNTWNLPAIQTEPTTSQYSSAADSTTTTAYNGDQQPVAVTEPGSVALTYSYDSMGDLTGQTGTGATAPTATRTFTYDDAGDMLTAATSNTATSGQSSNATSETFTYDDRGLPLTAIGSAGSTSFTYNGDGQQATVTDPLGTASYAYDNDGRLQTMSDPASGAVLTYSYNDMSQVSQVSYGSGGDTQTYGYNDLHQLTSDSLATSGASTVASISYGYDADGDLTSKTTAKFAGASANTYTYDEAGRLTSWDNGTTTTSYAYDADGNRTQAGNTTYTYDTRDELTSDGTSSYSYSANGDLTSVSGSSGTVTSSTDAYGQQGSQGSQTDVYDALGRDVQTAVTGGSTTSLSYEGTTGQLTSDGTSDYTWTPDGTLTGTTASAAPGAGVLDLTDGHTDLTGQFTATGTALKGSAAYGPWGSTITSTLAGSLGYQSQYTSPTTGQVDMGARWYNSANGDFGDKDTTANKPVPNSASASPYGYAADNPLDATDPSGHLAVVDVNGLQVPASDTSLIASEEKSATAEAAAQAQVNATLKAECPVYLSSGGCAAEATTAASLAPPDKAAVDDTAAAEAEANAGTTVDTKPTTPASAPAKQVMVVANPAPVNCGSLLECFVHNGESALSELSQLPSALGITSAADCIEQPSESQCLQAAGQILMGAIVIASDGEAGDGVVTEEAGTAGDDGQYLYRGVHADHPALTEAKAGDAEPWGGHSDPALHNGGNNQSIFTSWTTDPGIAYDVANEYGPEGVVLRIPASSVADRTVESPDIYDESEVLITGPVTGATVTDVSEFGRIWGFLGSR